MPKLKTFKSLAKRVKISKKGKVINRAKGQDHFNSRETGKTKRNKRRDETTSSRMVKSLKKYL